MPKKKQTKRAKRQKASHKKPHRDQTERVSRKVIEEIDEGIAEIYQNRDGSLPDMAHFEKRKRFQIIGALVTLCIAVGILAGVLYAGWYVYQSPGAFLEEDIIVSVSGEEEVVSVSDGESDSASDVSQSDVSMSDADSGEELDADDYSWFEEE